MTQHAEKEVVVFYCGRAVKPGVHLSEGINPNAGCRIRYVMLPCSSKIETLALLKLIEEGVDLVVVIGRMLQRERQRCNFAGQSVPRV